MNIHDDHMYHGAALIQVAEHPQFTAINSLKINGTIVPVAYKINDETALYLKYATKPKLAHQEYVFTFTSEHLADLKTIQAKNSKTFIALVCIHDREICCLSYDELDALVTRRREAKGEEEEQYAVLVTAPKGKELRVYVNAPGKKNAMLGKEMKVPRKAFPSMVFG
ncbi:hypothetical protein [Mitsuaria sp. GD03876]|uniref:hypothetical protein n=1 Tax=Mitsuaria sp. GD03876 TaxID=2975399 RepID=UPI00244D013F|nr:hypothetical protein [Mitsuaria sp. GD03876]MDH0865616.1 hypothetical protein [Mitsuaria sp. GD03876]